MGYNTVLRRKRNDRTEALGSVVYAPSYTYCLYVLSELGPENPKTMANRLLSDELHVQRQERAIDQLNRAYTKGVEQMLIVRQRSRDFVMKCCGIWLFLGQTEGVRWADIRGLERKWSAGAVQQSGVSNQHALCWMPQSPQKMHILLCRGMHAYPTVQQLLCHDDDDCFYYYKK